MSHCGFCSKRGEDIKRLLYMILTQMNHLVQNFSYELNSVISNADCVIMATGHSMYSSLSINDFKEGRIVVDTVRLLNKENFVNSKLIYVALGA